MTKYLVPLLLCTTFACSDDDRGDPVGTMLYFDLDGQVAEQDAFFDFPFPSDLRLNGDGTPDLTGFPNPKNIQIVKDLVDLADERPGFPVMPVTYFRFTAPLDSRAASDVIPASVDSPILLVDIDPDSPRRGSLYPTVALTLVVDEYLAGHGLAVAPRPGVVLDGARTYGVVVMRSQLDAEGAPLEPPSGLRQLIAGEVPEGAWGPQAADLYAPLWTTLAQIGVDPQAVAAATVFTTGDVVEALGQLSDRVMDEYTLTIDGLAVDADDGASHERYCELVATVSYPQFQQGTPPFNEQGKFEFGADGLPIKQRDEVAPIVLTLPKAPMPEAGYPLMIYFHGSGGRHSQVVDRGPVTEVGGEPTIGEGPAHVVAEFGIAAAGSALPVNPERVPGASDIAYLNLNNLAAFRDTFRQGVLEQRMFLDALRTLEIDPTALADCNGPSLPDGETHFRFDPEMLVALGQSMGGMYTNLVSPVEPRIKAAVPTGAGGFWNLFILETSLIPGTRDLMALILGTPEPELTFMHPGMHLILMAWEPSEPVVFMPRLARRPLPGHPVRSIYQPVGKDDEYFPISIYDAVTLAYGHEQAGELIWPSLQDALALDGKDGLIAYPVTENLSSSSDTPYTGAVVQYEGDGIQDPHVIFVQLEDVRYQYGCFLSTFLARGVATIPAPAPLGTPCP